MTNDTELKGRKMELDNAKTPLELYSVRRKIVGLASQTAIWRTVSPVDKTMLNLYFLIRSDNVVEVDQLKEMQYMLSDFFQITPATFRRSVALETRRLAEIPLNGFIQSDNKRGNGEKPFVQNYAQTDDAEKEGIIIGGNGIQYNFSSIYASYFEKVNNLLYRIYGDADRARDDTQEVFLNFWQTLGKLDDPNLKIGAYIYRMASNLANDRLRRDQVIKFVSSDQIEESGSAQGTNYELFSRANVSRLLGPEATVIDHAEKEALYEAFQKLPPRYRWVIALFDLDQFNHYHAAEIMDSTRSAMKSVHFRAVEELKKLLVHPQNNLLSSRKTLSALAQG